MRLDPDYYHDLRMRIVALGGTATGADLPGERCLSMDPNTGALMAEAMTVGGANVYASPFLDMTMREISEELADRCVDVEVEVYNPTTGEVVDVPGLPQTFELRLTGDLAADAETYLAALIDACRKVDLAMTTR